MTLTTSSAISPFWTTFSAEMSYGLVLTLNFFFEGEVLALPSLSIRPE
jgi:hypothetical protein